MSAGAPKVDDWFGCYSGSLKAWLVPAAFTHPAKFSRKLIERIYAHAMEEMWLVPGQRVLDPMAGISTGGIAAANAGLAWEGIELEWRFVEFSQQNFAKHRRAWLALGNPPPAIRQGDARQLGIAGADCVVSSPPYANESLKSQNPKRRLERMQNAVKLGAKLGRDTLGQLCAMPVGDIQAVISSPPYVSGGHHPDQTGSWGGLQEEKAIGLGTKEAAGYGQTPGQIGRMAEGEIQAVVTSPPYEKSMDSIENVEARRQRAGGFEQGQKNLRYGQNPYTFLSRDPSGLNNTARHAIAGQNPQIGQLAAETYWSAMRQVYENCFAILPPGGHIILVVKAFVRRSAIIDLPGQTCQLLDAIGFRVVHRHRAWLIAKEAQGRFDGGVDRIERKSFFRRLQERKGSPRIDFEEVLCAEKP